MATTKNALIRYKTIDKCLQNRSRRWTLEDLITACLDALYEYEGRQTNVSKRTVQLDIQHMRSNKLGYNAPITVYQKKYYTYSDEQYSITDIPLTGIDMDILSESMEILKQFKDFSLFSELNGVIQKLEDKIYRSGEKQKAIIHFDKNDGLKGLHYLDIIYQAILKKIVLRISYKSFSARSAQEIVFHSLFLKEYNNRWFVLGLNERSQKIMTLALDRIVDLNYDLKTSYTKLEIDPDEYYKNTYGVTVLTDHQLIDIEIKVDRSNAPYVETKPIHASQKVVDKFEDGSMLISLRVHHNFEIERLILGYGDSMQVIKPTRLKGRIKNIFKKALKQYEVDVD